MEEQTWERSARKSGVCAGSCFGHALAAGTDRGFAPDHAKNLTLSDAIVRPRKNIHKVPLVEKQEQHTNENVAWRLPTASGRKSHIKILKLIGDARRCRPR